MNYSEIKPKGPAARIIKCYWTLESEAEAEYLAEPIVPDGCPELVFNLNAPFQRLHKNVTQLQPKSIVIGQMKSAVTILPAGRIKIFGVRLWPFGLYLLLRENAFSITDKIETASAVFGKRGELLEEKVNEAQNTRERIEAVERAFDNEFQRDLNISFETNAMLRLIEPNLTNMRVMTIADNLGIGIKRLERRFKREIGLTPKFYSRLIRIKTLVAAVAENQDPNWADIGYSYGFSDQSHLLRDFKNFTGSSPKVFVNQDKRVFEHINR